MNSSKEDSQLMPLKIVGLVLLNLDTLNRCPKWLSICEISQLESSFC